MKLDIKADDLNLDALALMCEGLKKWYGSIKIDISKDKDAYVIITIDKD